MSMNEESYGYFRSPTLQDGVLVFVAEQNLWQVPLQGGTALRLTEVRSEVRTPVFLQMDSGLLVVVRKKGKRMFIYYPEMADLCGV